MNPIPEDLTASAKITNVIEKVAQRAKRLTERMEGKKLAQSNLAISTLFEYMVRVDWRIEDIRAIKSQFSAEAAKESPVIRTLQMAFVDRNEAFHRQVYGTLSVLILFLTHLCSRSIASQLPISSVQKFLKYISSILDKEDCRWHINTLLESVKYRAALLDHPQQSKLHHWMTMGTPTETIIIHYVPLYETIDRPVVRYHGAKGADPRGDDFVPPVDCESFYVSPSYEKTYTALCLTILATLEWCISLEKT